MAIPSLNDLVTYVNTKLRGSNWNSNLQQIINWFTDGTADVSFNSVTSSTLTGDVTGDLTGDLTGDVTGDLTGDVFANDGTKILENGIDGTDAEFTGNIIADLIKTQTASGDILIKNSSDVTILKMLNTRTVTPFNIKQTIGSFNANTTTDLVFSTLNEIGILFTYASWGGNVSNNGQLYFYTTDAFSCSISLIKDIGTNPAQHSVAFLSNSGAPNYNNTLRVTANVSSGGTVYKLVLTGKNYGF